MHSRPLLCGFAFGFSAHSAATNLKIEQRCLQSLTVSPSNPVTNQSLRSPYVETASLGLCSLAFRRPANPVGSQEKGCVGWTCVLPRSAIMPRLQ